MPAKESTLIGTYPMSIPFLVTVLFFYRRIYSIIIFSDICFFSDPSVLLDVSPVNPRFLLLFSFLLFVSFSLFVLDSTLVCPPLLSLS